MGRHRTGRSRFSLQRFFLIVFAIFCSTSIIWNVFLLYNHQLDFVLGIILIVAIATLLWNLLLFREYRVGSGTFIIVLLLTLLIVSSVSAYAGVEPLAKAKNTITSYFTNTLTSSKSETQNQSDVTSTSLPKTSQSKTIGEWNYTISNVLWVGNTVSMNMEVTNVGNRVIPFGSGGPNAHYSFTTDYKFCLVDSYNQIYWSKGDGVREASFYNQKYYPNEKKSGRLEFTVNPHSGASYLYQYAAGRPRIQLFPLGSPK